MTNPSISDAVAIGSLVGFLVSLLVGLAFYVWYALALSKVFPKLGADGWKGWVPIYNEVEILILGGVPGWSVIFYFIPIVQLYGVYLKITAVHRINLQFRRGAGMTVLGILLPPVWASILGWGAQPPSEFDQRVGSILPGQTATGVGPLSTPQTPPAAPVARDASGYVIPSAPAVGGAPVAPPAAVATPAPQDPPVTPEAPQAPAFISNPWAPQGVGSDVPAIPPVVPPMVRPPAINPIAPPPAPVGVGQPPSLVDPLAPVIVPPPVVAEPAAPEPVAHDPAIVEPVAAPTPEPIAEPEPEPVAAPVVESVFPTITTSTEDTEPRPVSLELPVPDDEDDDAATVVVDRRPRVLWRLVLDGGKSFDLTSDKVALGRNPASDDPDTQVLAVPDSTRTLSKTHASLQLSDGAWTVTDLHSTNGVIVVNDEEAETLLAPGRSSVVPGRFILGKVGMSIRPVEG